MMARYAFVEWESDFKKSQKFHTVKLAKNRDVAEMMEILFDIMFDE